MLLSLTSRSRRDNVTSLDVGFSLVGAVWAAATGRGRRLLSRAAEGSGPMKPGNRGQPTVPSPARLAVRDERIVGPHGRPPFSHPGRRGVF